MGREDENQVLRERAERAERERDDIASVHEGLRALFPERPIVNMIEAVRTLRARVAELEALLPTPDEYERVRDAVEGEIEDGGTRARREWIGGAWPWIDRMDAARAKGGQ